MVLSAALFSWFGLQTLDALVSADWLQDKQRHRDDGEMLDARKAAAYVKDNSSPQDRMLYFGHLIEIPLFAERRPATPYVVPWLMMAGHGSALGGKAELTAGERERLDAMRERLQSDFCTRLLARPPEVIAVSDSWCDDNDCLKDMKAMCTGLDEVIARRYQAPVTFGLHRVVLMRPGS